MNKNINLEEKKKNTLLIKKWLNIYYTYLIIYFDNKILMSQVVNCKVGYIRPKYNNLKEWMDDGNNVYIGRKCIVIINGKRYPKKDSLFANPFKIDEKTNREEVLKKYKIYIKEKIEKNPDLKNELLKLDNKKLGCWCKPFKCHGDILIKMIKKIKKMK